MPPVRLHLGLLGAYVALAVAHTWPLVRHIDTHLPGLGLGDNVSFIWNNWWMREALASSSHEFFISPLMQSTVGVPLILHTHAALTAFLSATLLAPLPVIMAQNVLLIGSLALNGLGAYVLSRTAGGARGPSMLAGALFLVASPVTARLMGHYNLVLAWPLAFACAAYVTWWRAPTRWKAVLVAATAALVPYADYYYAVFFGVFALGYGASRIWRWQPEATRRGRTWASTLLFTLAGLAAATAATIALLPAFQFHIAGTTISVRTTTNAMTAAWFLALAGGVVHWRPRLRLTRRDSVSPALTATLLLALPVFLILLTPLIVPAWTLWSSGDYVTQTSSLKSGPQGVDVATLVLGPPFGGVLGPTVRGAYASLGLDVMESSAWLGLGTMLLALVALRRASPSTEVRRWMAIAACFGVWALGPYLIVVGHNTGIVLPQALAHVVPLVNNARIPGRAMAACALALSVVVAIALSSTAQSSRSWRLVGLLAALAVGESLAAPLPLSAVPPPGVYADIARGSESGAVLSIPFGVRDGFGEKGLLEHDALYGQTLHRRPIAGGFIARLPPRVWSWYETHEPFNALLTLSTPGAALSVTPSCESILAGLRAGSIAYVVFYPEDASAALSAMVNDRMPLRRIAEDDRRVLFAVDLTRREPCGPSAR
jgi:hypothetical protein